MEMRLDLLLHAEICSNAPQAKFAQQLRSTASENALDMTPTIK
jgi:hypothetical protein